MPKQEKIWNGGMPSGPIGPFVWQAWVKGSKNPIRVVAFDLEHIKDQLEGKVVVNARRMPEEKISVKRSEPLGPNGGNGVTRPPDYDNGFKVLRKWVDENGGPPEEVRKRLRELYIDYDRVGNGKKSKK